MPLSFTLYRDRDNRGAEKQISCESPDLGSSLATLHELCWATNKPDLCFHRVQVERDATPASSNVPDQPFVLQWDDLPRDSFADTGAEFLKLFAVRSVLVRREYIKMLQEIIDVCLFHLPERTSSSNAYADSIQNPFTGQLPMSIPCAGAIVTGSPGIGKSTFLAYIIALRVLAGKTTVFQADPSVLYVINADGVFLLHLPIYPSRLQQHLDEGAWLLFDSNSELKEPHTSFLNLRAISHCFLVQAASPSPDRIKWITKSGAVPLFWMEHWNPGELVAGRDLQLWFQATRPSEKEIVDFCKLYGTSPRTVYNQAANPSFHGAFIEEKLHKLSRDSILRLLRDANGMEKDDTFSRHLVVATPTDTTRTRHNIDIASEHVIDLVLNRLRAVDAEAFLNLYWILVTNRCTRACARYLLEKTFLEQFRKGGVWPVTDMKKSTGQVNTLWKASQARSKYLVLGYKNRPTSEIVADRYPLGPLNPDTVCLKYHEFKSEEALLSLEDGFYRPLAKNQGSFDAFVFDAQSGVVTLFLVTVTSRHELVQKGFGDLKAAKKIDLVVVTCPEYYGGAQGVYMAKESYEHLKEKLRSVYLLDLRPTHLP